MEILSRGLPFLVLAESVAKEIGLEALSQLLSHPHFRAECNDNGRLNVAPWPTNADS
jgi:hypothetical protein